jgi:cytochrome c peroxidase
MTLSCSTKSRKRLLGLAVVAALGAAALVTHREVGAQQPAQAPVFAPLPDAPRLDARRVELGRMLFFDERLAGDTSASCATCHNPDQGWGDGQPLSRAYTGLEYFRNAPGLFNSFARRRFTWDGRLDGSDPGTLVRDMITEAHFMNADTRMVQERLKQVPDYARAFQELYGGDPYGGMIYGAVAEFLRSIRTTNAPFDRFLRGDQTALSAEARRGMDLFAGRAGCTGCHNGPMLSDFRPHVTGAPDHPDLHRNADRQVAMLRHFATMGVPNFMNRRQDVGYLVVSKEERHNGAFVTPSLWDVGQTAPYMRSGVFATLEEVVAFYDRGGGDVPNRATQLRPLNLSATDRADLVAFLHSLTGDAPRVERPSPPDYGVRDMGRN